MPILYVNPSRGRASGKARVHLRRKARKAKARRAGRLTRNPARKKAKRSTMANSKRRKRRGGKRRARRTTKRRTTRRKRKASPTKRRRRKAKSTGGKRRRRKRKASPTKRRRRKAKSTGKRRTRRRKRKGSRRASGTRRRRRRRASAAKTVRMGAPSMYGPGGTKVIYRSNPARRRRRAGGKRRRTTARRRGRLASRHRRRYRRNPSIGAGLGGIMGMLKQAAPVMVTFLLSRVVIAKATPRIPMIDRLPVAIQKPLVALGVAGLVHVATKRIGALAKYRVGAITGVGLSLFEQLIASFAPDSVKAAIGLSGDGLYDQALNDYVTVGDYLQTGASPIDDDLALSDYVTIGAVEEELGALGDGLEQELGLEQEMGDSLGEGVSQSEMLSTIPSRQFVGPVPSRSFTKGVPHAGQGYDSPNVLYTGIFGGGF